MGRRIREIAGLTWDRIDLGREVVPLDPGTTKNKEGRTIFLDDELKELLRAQWEARKGNGDKVLPWVFLNRNGIERVKRFEKAWEASCEKAEIGIRLFHDLRRTSVRNMVRAGIPETVAMQISGRKTRSVFDCFDIVSEVDLKAAAMKQAACLERQLGAISGTISSLITVKP